MAHVVGAAIIRAGRVLAARRTTPPEAAGGWEFPGGKVEPDETPEAALIREVAEELGCRIVLTAWLTGRADIPGGHTLTVAAATLDAGEPSPEEHDRIAWLGPDELDSVAWLEPDLPFLDEVRSWLGSAP